MKQQNLFGQPVVEDPNKGVGLKGKRKATGKEKTKADHKRKSESPLPDGSVAEPRDAQMDDDSQAATNIDPQVQEVETQLEETQLNGSSPPDTEVDTQPGTGAQTEEEETQLETQVDEDDGEPVSRFAWSLPNSLAEGWTSVLIRLLIGPLHHRERPWWNCNRSCWEPRSGFAVRFFGGPGLYIYVRTIIHIRSSCKFRQSVHSTLSLKECERL